MMRIKSKLLGMMCAFCGCFFTAAAQSLFPFEAILHEIEEHSPRIGALKAQLDASLSEIRQSTVLEDPEVEFAYFFGDPSSVGNRWDLGVSQSFDFPTTYLHRRRAARQAGVNVQWQYRAERQDILLQAHQLCIEWVYYNGVIALSERQLGMAEELKKVAAAQVEAGDITVLDFNKIWTDYQTRRSDLERFGAEREAVIQELRALNGDFPLVLTDTAYTFLSQTLPADFETWWEEVAAQSPALCYAEGEVERARQEVRVAKSEWWPKLSLGYASENGKEESLYGVVLGVSLPAWNNRYKVRQARAAETAARQEALDRRLVFMAQLRGLYRKAQTQYRVTKELADVMFSQDTERLLAKAYREGQLTRQEYLTGLMELLDQRGQLLSDERDYQLTLSELWAVGNFSR